mgnify:CR=1 FL=1
MSDKFKEAKYDERQTAVRGRAFKYAYGTLLAALLLYVVTDGIWDWCVPLTGCAAAIAMDPNSGAILGMVSLGNFDLNDYQKVSDKDQEANTSRIGQYVVFVLLGLMNLGLALASWLEGDLTEDGVLQTGGANLILGLVFIYIFAVAMIQRARQKRAGDDD